MQSENNEEISVINSDELNTYPTQKDLESISDESIHPNLNKLSEFNSVEIKVVDTTENLSDSKMDPKQSIMRENENDHVIRKTFCQKNCSHRVARVFYWLGMILIIASIFGLYFSIVNLYEPATRHYYQNTCQVNECINSDVLLTCCSGIGITRQCTTKFYTSLHFTFIFNQTVNYTKTEVYDCNGPIGQNSWEYPGMCDDPLLNNIKCYYDDRDIYDSLHLTNAYQYPIEVITAISIICVFVFIIIFWLIYSFAYCACFRQLH